MMFRIRTTRHGIDCTFCLKDVWGRPLFAFEFYYGSDLPRYVDTSHITGWADENLKMVAKTYVSERYLDPVAVFNAIENS